MDARELEGVILLAPVEATDAGVSGEWTDLQGFVNPGGREMKFLLMCGAGSTDGEVSGVIQEASDTAGTDLAVSGTFGNVTTAAPSNELHAVVNQRYVRVVADVETGGGMIVCAYAFGTPRVLP